MTIQINSASISEVEKATGIPRHRLAHVIRTRHIDPTSRLGGTAIFDEAAVRRMIGGVLDVERHRPQIVLDRARVERLIGGAALLLEQSMAQQLGEAAWRLCRIHAADHEAPSAGDILRAGEALR